MTYHMAMEEIKDAIEAKPLPEPKKNFNAARFVYSVLVVFAAVFTVGIFFGRIVFFPIKVEGASMQPTLNASATERNDNCDTVYLGSARTVSRGDIIVFNSGSYTESASSSYYIKRAIGLPGDTIYFARSGTENEGKIYYDIYVNGVKLEETYIKEPMWFDQIRHNPSEVNFFNDYVETNKKIVLGKDQYFLMGDNRNNSLDSRVLGLISKEDFLGKVYLQIKAGQSLLEAIIQKIF